MPSPRRLDTKQTRSRNFFNKVFLPGLGTIYLQRFLSFEIFSMDVAKMTERYIEPLKIRTDIRQGGSVRMCETWLIIIWAATGSKLAPFRDVSISSSFRSKEKQGSCNITQFLERQFPLGQVGFVLRYFAFALSFEEQGLVQLVIAPPAMGEVPNSIPKCDLQSPFPLLSFPCSFK